MAAFLEDVTPFMGDGSVNEEGQSLKEFLKEYNPNKYQNPSVTADILVVQYKEREQRVEKGLKVLLIQRRNHPGIGTYALPGGFVEIKENTDEAAKRELKEETGLEGIAMEQLYCWGNYNRDPRTRIVTVSYLALVEEELTVKAGDDAKDALWFEVDFKAAGPERMNGERRYQNYQIHLNNECSGRSLHALVEYSEQAAGYLKQPEYLVLETDGIAFDHPSFIVQGLRHIKKLWEQ